MNFLLRNGLPWHGSFLLKITMKFWFLFFSLFCFLPIAGGEKWVNYLENQSCTVIHYYTPKTLEELRQCVKEAAIEDKKVRVVGKGYSLSNLVCTEGVLINLKNFNKILSINRREKLVRVQAGITIQELNVRLASYGLALPNQSAFDSITLGGALAVGVHGTGPTGTFSSFVREIELIDAGGNIHILSLTSDPEAFAAAQVSLGALGVMYAVTLHCEPLFYLKVRQEKLDIDRALLRCKELLQNSEFFQFSWDIAQNKALMTHWSRAAPEEGELCYKALTYHSLDENDRDLFSEIAVPLDQLPEVMERLKRFLAKYRSRGEVVANVVVRFVVGEKAYLSPASGCSVAYFTMSIPRENTSPVFYQEFEELMLTMQGRPHWGKIHFMDYEKAHKAYGENLDKFIQVKKRLDPQRVFSNAFIHSMCGER